MKTTTTRVAAAMPLEVATFKKVPWLSSRFSSLNKLTTEDCALAQEVLDRLFSKLPALNETPHRNETMPPVYAAECMKRKLGTCITWLSEAKIEFSPGQAPLLKFSQEANGITTVHIHRDVLKLDENQICSLAAYIILFGCSSSQLDGDAGTRAIGGYLSTMVISYVAADSPQQLIASAAVGLIALADCGWDTAPFGITLAHSLTLFPFSPGFTKHFESSSSSQGNLNIWKTLDSGVRQTRKQREVRIPTSTHQQHPTVAGFDILLAEKFSLTRSQLDLLAQQSYIVPTRKQSTEIKCYGDPRTFLNRHTLGWLASNDWFSKTAIAPRFLQFLTTATDPLEFNIETFALRGNHGLHPAAAKGIQLLRAVVNGYNYLTSIIGAESVSQVMGSRSHSSIAHMARFYILLRDANGIDYLRGEKQMTSFDSIFGIPYTDSLLAALADRPGILRIFYVSIRQSTLQEESTHEAEQRAQGSFNLTIKPEERSQLKQVPVHFVRRYGFILKLLTEQDFQQASYGYNYTRGIPTEPIFIFCTPRDVLASIEKGLTEASHLLPITDAIASCCTILGSQMTQTIQGLVSERTSEHSNIFLGKKTGEFVFALFLRYANTNDLEALPFLNLILRYGSTKDLKSLSPTLTKLLSQHPGKVATHACATFLRTEDPQLLRSLFTLAIGGQINDEVGALIRVAQARQATSQEVLGNNNHHLFREIVRSKTAPVPLKVALKHILTPQQFRNAAEGLDAAVLANAFDNTSEVVASIDNQDDRMTQLLVRGAYATHRKHEKAQLTFTDYTSGEEGIPNHYSVLGVPFDANEDEIKASYRLLSRAFHPDVTTDEREKKLSGAMQERLNSAKEHLLDGNSRAEFDAIINANHYDRRDNFFPKSCWFDSDEIEIKGFERPQKRGGFDRKSASQSTSNAHNRTAPRRLLGG